MPYADYAVRNFTSIIRAGGFSFKGRRVFGLQVINKTGSNIAADKLVAISGYDVTSKLPKVVLADADSADLATDVFVALRAITNGKTGNVYKGGTSAANLNTNFGTVGDPVYLDTTAGAFTGTAPTSSNARLQVVGYTMVKSATVGQIAWDIKPASKLSALDMQGVGFASGQGSAVTQITSRTTGVTINAICGAITTDTSSLAAGAEAEFTVTNSFVAATDVVVVSLKTESTTGTSLPYVSTTAAGSFKITLTNLHASTADTSASVINFVVIKAVAA